MGDYFVERIEFTQEKLPLYSLTIEEGIVPKSERYEREFLVKDVEKAYKVMKSDDFALNPMNLRFGAIARHKKRVDVLVSRYYNIFSCNALGNSVFFEYYLSSESMIAYYNKMATGSLIEKKRVHYLDFVQFKKKLPCIEEQTKIANFLSSIDKKISQCQQQIEQTTQWKRGLLQEMFV